MATRLEKSKRGIQEDFELAAQTGKRVYSRVELIDKVRKLREEKKVTQDFGLADFIKLLKAEGRLEEVKISSKVMRDEKRYAWGKPSVFEFGVSLRPRAYLCHASAVFLHGLTEQIPRTIYVNCEQSAKPEGKGTLVQDRIDRAFANEQRRTRAIYRILGHEVVLLNGKSTGLLEVGEVNLPETGKVPVTKLERTLIDIAVRPAYAGGVHEVLRAYEAAKDRVSGAVLVATLKTLHYGYPYHQAIGFLMERAGYPVRSVEKLLKIDQNYDFYLAHAMREKDYVERWRLYVPKGF